MVLTTLSLWLWPAPASSAQLPAPAPRAEFAALCQDMTSSDLQFYGRGRLAQLESARSTIEDSTRRWSLDADYGEALLFLNEIQPAIDHLSDAWMRSRETGAPKEVQARLLSPLILAHLQAGEDANCVLHRSASSCILPLQPDAVHQQRQDAVRAGDLSLELLQLLPPNFEVTWILNLSRMLSGDFPAGVPDGFRLPATTIAPEVDDFEPWIDRSREMGMDQVDLAGGAIVDDFDGDGLLDLVTSTWDPCDSIKAFRNNGEGRFENVTKDWGLDEQLGAFNILQADYDNDGDLDLLALRGGWLFDRGRIRNSLLRNDATPTGRRFVDTTRASGLAEPPYPTQTAAWGDFDNDGHLDLYVGNEHSGETAYPSQLFRNRGDGTFEDVANEVGAANDRFAKGVTWGDYDDDGDLDLYVSNHGPNRLYRNEPHESGGRRFRDVATEAGVVGPDGWTFATWFFDPDNDGDLDLFVADYRATTASVAASYFGAQVDAGSPFLFRNDGGGRFESVGREWGLVRPSLPMGANYGDLDNDGWLDIYLGTGEPSFQSQVPNVMYRNRRGEGFEEVTFAGGFGHLQKGHGVAFGDLDQDGDQDLLHQLGGFYPADSYANVVFVNPGNGNRFVHLELEGRSSNRSAIGARIEVRVTTPRGPRSVYAHVSPGGSFGGSSLRQEIGLGDATRLEEIRVRWPGTNVEQVFTGADLDGLYRLVQGQEEAATGLATALPFRRVEENP